MNVPIDMDDVFDFIGVEFRRPFVYATKLVKAKHVFNVRLRQTEGRRNVTEIFAMCIPGSNFSGDPHQIKFEVEQVSVRYQAKNVNNIVKYL